MNLLPDRLAFGVAPALLLDCARQVHEGRLGTAERPLSLDAFSKTLGAPLDESAPVLQALTEAGFFQHIDDGTYLATPKLARLALSKISGGIPRAEAVTLLAQIVEKAAWVNQRAVEFEHRITCLVVFGSCLDDKPVLGDLDIGVAMEELPRSRKDSSSAIEEILKRHLAAQRRTLSALRLRQPKKISLHALDEVLELKTPYQVVFGSLPPAGPDKSSMSASAQGPA